jgi:hypothetical protein
MSLGDAFSDAVVDIDRYLLDPCGTSAEGTYSRELAIAARNLLDVVRCLIDAESMGLGLDRAVLGVSPFDPTATADTEGADNDD